MDEKLADRPAPQVAESTPEPERGRARSSNGQAQNGRPRGADPSALALAESMGMGRGGGGGAISLRSLRTFSSFQVPAFRLYFAAMVGQGSAMNMQMMAQSLLVYRVTGSAAALGIMSLANAVPMLVFSLFGGVLADRVKKKYVFIAGQLASAVIAAIVGFALTSGYLSEGNPGSFWVLVAASLAQGIVMGLIAPARQAFIAEVVGEERLMNAISLSMLEMNTLRLIAPAVGGFLIEGFGFQSIYYVMAGMYVFSGILILPLNVTSTMKIGGSGAVQQMLDGLRYVRSETTLFLVLVITFFSILLSMPYMTLLPMFTEDVLKVGAGGMGVLLSVSGIGAMACALVLASLPNKRRGAMLMVGCIILGLALLGFSISHWWYLSLVMIVFVGLGQTARMSLANTLLNYYVDAAYRGRVMSLMMMEFGLTSFGAFATAMVAGAVGVQWAVGTLAVLLIVMATAGLVLVPRIRRLD